MKKRHPIHFICFLLIFLISAMNLQVLADTVVNVTSVSLSKSTDVLTIGQTDILTAAVLPSNATNKNLLWVSTNPNVVKVFNGAIMAVGQGTAVITVYTQDGSKTANCVVIVKNPVSTISLDKATVTLTVGQSDKLTASISPSQAITWTSSDSNVVQVFNGLIMAQSQGTAVITATTADGTSSTTCKVTVSGPTPTITLNKTSVTLLVGGIDKLVATVTPALPSKTYLMWVTSSPDIVTVSAGLITAKSLGSAVITAIASDGSLSATCKVTVTEPAKTIRLGGANRYETSVAISKSRWQEGSAYAVLATGNDYPDALSAAPLAKKYNAPILLTDKNVIPQIIFDEIKRLKTTHIFICGGTGAVSKEIENQLNTIGISTERLEGNDRYETSVAIANKLGASSGEIMVANGYDWSDALSASSIAAKMGVPILLTGKDVLPDSIDSYIGKGTFSKTYVLGDTELIDDTIAGKFPNSERISGSTSYERNINIIKRFQSNLDLSSICVATGTAFPDALSGSSLAAVLSSAIVLVDNNSLQDVTTQFATSSLSQTQYIYVFGLQGAVTDDTLSKLFSK